MTASYANRVVVFLDLDGVLNSVDWFDRRGDKTPEQSHLAFNIDPVCLARLNKITIATKALIVFSSSWRGGSLRKLNSDFKALGLRARFIGQTPRLPRRPDGRSQSRGAEIQRWLDEQGPVRAFVILDDGADMEHLLPFLVRTDPRAGGLSDADVENAIAMLASKVAV